MEETNQFHNQQLDVSGLPSMAEVDYQPLEKNYKTLSLLMVIITFVILFFATVIPLLIGGFYTTWTRILGYFGILIILFLIRLFIKYYGYGKKGYAIRDHDVLFKSGIWWKRFAFIPRNRIQHIEIKKGPLEDVFDISRILIFTAGGSGSDLVIPGLHPDTAERIKTYLMDKMALDEEE